MPSNSRKFRRFLIPGIFLLSIIVAVILIVSKPKTETARAKEVARTINVLQVTTASLAPTVPVFAKVTTPNHASLRAAITADITRLIALQGSRVKAGEELVILDDREAKLTVKQRQADVQEAKSQIDAALLQHENELYVIRNDEGKRAEHNRQQIIKNHKIVLHGLEAKKLRAESTLQLAELDLQRTHVLAPFDGQVTTVHVSVGDRVRPGDKIIDLFDTSAIELTGTIAARYISSLHTAINQGMLLTARGSINGQQFLAHLQRLSGDVNERSGGVDAIFSIQSGQALMQLGRSLKLQMNLPPMDNAFIVPNTALYGTDLIYKVTQDRLKAVKTVRLGDFTPQDGLPHSLLFSDEINDGDLIMTTQLPSAVENLLVKIINPS